MAYAAWSDVQGYVGPTVTLTSDTNEQARLLTRAADLLDTALLGAQFNVDTNGNPTDASVIAALKNATCAQIEWWYSVGDELGTENDYAEMSLGPARLVKPQRGPVDNQSPLGRLAPRARDELLRAQLLPLRITPW